MPGGDLNRRADELIKFTRSNGTIVCGLSARRLSQDWAGQNTSTYRQACVIGSYLQWNHRFTINQSTHHSTTCNFFFLLHSIIMNEDFFLLFYLLLFRANVQSRDWNSTAIKKTFINETIKFELKKKFPSFITCTSKHARGRLIWWISSENEIHKERNESQFRFN